MPELLPGNYDFVLYDQARELVRMPGAITVVPPPAVIATVRVRFVAGQEVLDVMNIGDVDLSGLVAQEDTEGAVLMAIGQDRQRIDGLFSDGLTSDGLLGRNFQVEGSTLSFTGRVRGPVVLGQSGWTYRNQAIKVGAGFTFESILGVMRGFIFDMVISDQEGGVLR